jgi:hypothetical protein
MELLKNRQVGPALAASLLLHAGLLLAIASMKAPVTASVPPASAVRPPLSMQIHTLKRSQYSYLNPDEAMKRRGGGFAMISFSGSKFALLGGLLSVGLDGKIRVFDKEAKGPALPYKETVFAEKRSPSLVQPFTVQPSPFPLLAPTNSPALSPTASTPAPRTTPQPPLSPF